MPRKKRKYNKSEIKPDPKFHSLQVSRFINKIMKDGKKSTARKIVYDAFSEIESKLEKEPLEVLTQAISNIRPQQEVRSRRVGGATYQVPVPVRAARSETIAMRWIIQQARQQRGEMSKNLSKEIIAAYKGEGEVIRKKENTHKMAEANRAFAHFRW